MQTLHLNTYPICERHIALGSYVYLILNQELVSEILFAKCLQVFF